jgi:lipopolysaccharide exporter
MSNTSKALNGGKWISLATAVSTVFQFVQLAVLARLLSPADFGLVSISNLIINFFGLFASLGFANSIIYKQENDRAVLSSLYTLSLGLGVLLSVLVFMGAPLLGMFYNEARLEPVVRLSSVYFVIVGAGQIYLFLLQKELRFRTTAQIDIAGSVVGSGLTIGLALAGFQEMSLIIGMLVTQTVKTVLQVVAGWSLFRPVPGFEMHRIREHLNFGLFNLADGLVGFVQSNADNIMVGRLLGVDMLGYYTVASQLAVFPITKLNPIILQVAYPILARMKDNTADLRRSYLRILDVISYCNLPLLAGLFITADGVVPLAYGPGWEPAVGLIRIFVFVGLFACLAHPLFTLAYTKGKPNLMLYLNIGTMAVKIPLVLFFARWGVTGIAWAFVTATGLNLIADLAVARWLVGGFLGDFFRNIARPVLFCALMMGVIVAYKLMIGSGGWVHTLAQVGLGGAVYAGLTLRFKLSWRELLGYRQALSGGQA